MFCPRSALEQSPMQTLRNSPLSVSDSEFDTNTINLGGGNDIYTGGDGIDIIYGGYGDDTIKTGRGKDIVDGGSGNDIIEGGKGNDMQQRIR